MCLIARGLIIWVGFENQTCNRHKTKNYITLLHNNASLLIRLSGYKVWHQDETWCNTNHTREYVWQLDESSGSNNLIANTQWSGGLKVPSGAGRRLIINHIGCEDGFLEGCGEVFEGKKGYSISISSLQLK